MNTTLTLIFIKMIYTKIYSFYDIFLNIINKFICLYLKKINKLHLIKYYNLN